MSFKLPASTCVGFRDGVWWSNWNVARARLVNMRGKSTVKEGRIVKIKNNEKSNEEGCGNAKEFKGNRPGLKMLIFIWYLILDTS